MELSSDESCCSTGNNQARDQAGITQLSPTNDDKTFWTGEMYDSSFENLLDGPVTFTLDRKSVV